MHYAYLLIPLAGVASSYECKEWYEEGGYCNRVGGKYSLPAHWKNLAYPKALHACQDIHGGISVPSESLTLSIPELPCQPASSTEKAETFFINYKCCI
ncbi:hypothetical protein P3342_013553 [Pyrenophora teres f. teres]|uniref:Uncharacterized protein n=1 Tax=Pyrenophora teres f. teres TaxID=97479 RepID=A0A6S6WHN8_9PLEO|nr:hypothetical protein PTNB85_10229 [Pyrenophora teres f. teres]KAE8823167.1 hypothetical protein HRS9139_09576 [Pyrenophora teres f. teres]KAE8854342.1 hypothetical protein PTNB29_09698 [Pyrenophora teres f. teres]KAK1908233.1 hypothetical protein P3342_013553 [Pyrenophora teres f. teres]CAE7220498.1 hypothetical protein PTTW11_11319 [Pyrenophora teres f. teres]